MLQVLQPAARPSLHVLLAGPLQVPVRSRLLGCPPPPPAGAAHGEPSNRGIFSPHLISLHQLVIILSSQRFGRSSSFKKSNPRERKGRGPEWTTTTQCTTSAVPPQPEVVLHRWFCAPSAPTPCTRPSTRSGPAAEDPMGRGGDRPTSLVRGVHL